MNKIFPIISLINHPLLSKQARSLYLMNYALNIFRKFIQKNTEKEKKIQGIPDHTDTALKFFIFFF